MNRRGFFRSLLGLMAIPFVGIAKSRPQPTEFASALSALNKHIDEMNVLPLMIRADGFDYCAKCGFATPIGRDYTYHARYCPSYPKPRVRYVFNPDKPNEGEFITL